jgi:pyruvate/2-oxoglutarate dehydrogenase complex dihydrolipoamide acyltransferase (E2) component
MKRFYSSSIFSGPAVKHLFLQFPHVNPSLISSTGKNGRITKQDFLNYLEKNSKKEEQVQKKTTPVVVEKTGLKYQDLPSKMLNFEKNQVAHFYVQLECPIHKFKNSKYSTEDILSTVILKTLQNHPNCNVKRGKTFSIVKKSF